MGDCTRRSFLKTSGTAVGAMFGTMLASKALALDVLTPVLDPLGAYPYRGWEPLYRDLWTYDYFSRAAHSMNCTGSCTWKVYVKNGIAFKEEQFADYPNINMPGDPGYNPLLPTIPTYNPRGCQKGACQREYAYGPQRTKYPLIRTGPRGSGMWRRASWPEALNTIATGIVNAINTPWTDKNGVAQNYSPDTVHFYAAIPAKHQITVAGGFRLANLLGSVAMSFYDWYCDLPPGEPQTWAVQTDSCESADWVNSKLLMLMGANLLETRIPDAHFFTEARARGTKVIAVFPDYNAASTHADIFVPLKPGTDGALCLGMANYIVTNNLHDIPYIKKYTDMPFLVRSGPTDPLKGKFLRVSDAQNLDGSPVDPAGFNSYYVWDTITSSAVLAPGTAGDPNKTLNLGLVDPALEGNFVVNGVQVTTVFSLLKQKLVPFDLNTVATITGLDTSLITQLAQEFATTKPARIIEGAGTNHYFHNDLTNRSQILLLALTGNVGLPGSGFDHYVGQEKIWPEEAWFHLAYPYGRPRQRFQNTTLWTYVHGNSTSDVDNLYPRPLSSYIQESVDKGWMPLWPKDTLNTGRTPKVLIIWGGNYINQSKGFNNLVNTLLPKLNLIVDINLRMDTSAYYADVVLPAAGMFEKFDLNTTDLHTFAIPFTPVIDPQFYSKSDWQIWRSLAQALAATGFSFQDTVPDGTVINRNFANLLKDFDRLNTVPLASIPNPPPFPPKYGPVLKDDRAAVEYILANAPETAGFTMQGNHRFPTDADLALLPDSSIIKHPKRFPATSHVWTSTLKPGVPYYGHQRMVEELRPLETMVGRQQFYIDHDWYLNEFGEELPTFKGTVDADPYPLRWVTPHGRWSIHSTWRDAKYQLRLQRGRMIVYLSPAEATARGLLDNDLVEVFNGHGAVQAHLCITPRLPAGMALMYHGWERYTNNTGWQAPTPVRINPTELVGKYGQLSFRLNYWGPTGSQKDTRVDIRKV